MSVVAVDLATETLEVARAQTAVGAPVEYQVGDAYKLSSVAGTFDAGLVAFWWSHVALATLHGFLTGLHQRLGAGALVLVLDNRYVKGSNHPISRTDAAGNTYQHRTLENGEDYEVLKNFPSRANVVGAVVSAGGSAPAVHELQYFWYATYVVAGAS
jgi:demethylmenaquinone methyltransferase/2-methoxy-6-polyprenyl-1,4-benzoquinol methylase